MIGGQVKKESEMNGNLRDISAPTCTGIVAADQPTMGLRCPPQQQIRLYSGAQWEEFVEECAHFCLKPIYIGMRRFIGTGTGRGGEIDDEFRLEFIL